MKIITLHQPWATLIALGFKQYETRSWATKYRGTIAIHAAKRHIDPDGIYAIQQVHDLTGGKVPRIRGDYPLGAIVAIADLVDCEPMSNYSPTIGQVKHFEKGTFETARWHVLINAMTPLERAVGDWQAGRYAWRLNDVIALPEPIPYKGSQGLGNVSEEVQQQIKTMCNEVTA